MRIRDPKTTALIFASGKMVCTGAKSEEHSKLANRKYARIVQKLGFPATFKDFKIQNIVASCNVKFPIRLEGLAYSHGAFSSVLEQGGLSPNEVMGLAGSEVLQQGGEVLGLATGVCPSRQVAHKEEETSNRSAEEFFLAQRSSSW